jgi:hypothetical protein
MELAASNSMRRPKVADELSRHTSAARAFHTGFISETHRLRMTLDQMTPHLGELRRQALASSEKLAAAEASCRHLKMLKRIAEAWRDTYRDLHASVSRVRGHLRRLANRESRTKPNR